MKEIEGVIKVVTNVILDLILTVLAILMIIAMVKQLFLLGQYTLHAFTKNSFETIIHASLSFFMYFEFTMMIKKYIDEDRHIPIRYLVYIAITAILRQEMVIHDNAMETLILSIAIFLLVITLIALQLTGERPTFWHPYQKKGKDPDDE